MNRKDRRCVYLLLVTLAALANPWVWAQEGSSVWDSSPIGSCDVNFLKHINEERRRSKELVVVREGVGTKSKNKYFLTWDSTPSRNPTKLLYEVRNGRGCVILFMPYADVTDFKIAADGRLPTTVTSETQPMPNAMGGYESILATYELDKDLGVYKKHPIYCEKKTESSKVKIDCEDAFQ